MSEPGPPIVILGAGINGCALARELVLNGVGVELVDRRDVACGATAYSSRLIHGGLRYLEYREFDLVRESLSERTRLLRLAPHLVRPLELFIPTTNLFGGFLASAARFLGADVVATNRGLMLVRFGLRFYDSYARDRSLPRHRTHRMGAAGTPRVNAQRYRFLCSYYDGQVHYPERFTLALLTDAERIAALGGVEFRVSTYHEARLDGSEVILSGIGPASGEPERQVKPAALVNATGAWVDATLDRLNLRSQRLMGGTQGSHLVTRHQGLRDALGGKAIYTEAADGRPVFLLPLSGCTLVGTTDTPFEGDPGDAVASDEEIAYLIQTVNEVIGDLSFAAEDVDFHYCGVRPLPYVGDKTPGSVTRRHRLEENRACPLPFYSVIGGKLTTCRSLAEEVVAALLPKIGRKVTADSRERVFPGSENYPTDEDDLKRRQSELAERFQIDEARVAAIWELYGTRTGDLLSELDGSADADRSPRGLATALARHAVHHEWARTLEDLVLRRLMLLYEGSLDVPTLRDLADVLVGEGLLEAGEVQRTLDELVNRLSEGFGYRAWGASA